MVKFQLDLFQSHPVVCKFHYEIHMEHWVQNFLKTYRHCLSVGLMQFHESIPEILFRIL